MQNIEDVIQQIKRLTIAQKTILTTQEFCEYAGLSKSFVYKLTSERRIAYSSPSGKLNFFLKEDVDEWLMSNPIRSINQIDSTASNFVLNSQRRRMNRT